MRQCIAFDAEQMVGTSGAVDNEWGGRNSGQSADQLVDEILSWFLHADKLFVDDPCQRNV